MADKQAEYDASFEEEKRRYEADPDNYWGNPNSPWAREEARRQRLARQRSQAQTVELDVDGPADEIEALKARLVAALRRQPADVRFLMRIARELSRMEAAAHRLHPDKQHKLAGSFLAVMNSLNDPRMPPEDY